MHFSNALFALLPLLSVSLASPLPLFASDGSKAASLVQRSSAANEPWAWASPQFERSPSDPELHVGMQRRIVYNPRITYPRADTVWSAGQEARVTWNTDDIPHEARDFTVKLMLGYEPASGEGGLNLHVELANNVPVLQNEVTFTLPDVGARKDYIVVLMGDSGNASPHFVIETQREDNSGNSFLSEPIEDSLDPFGDAFEGLLDDVIFEERSEDAEDA